MPAEHFIDGRWEQGEDILADVWSNGASESEALAKTGFRKLFSIGSEDGISTPVTLDVYLRDARPRVMISIETPELIPRLYVDNLANAMDVVAKWAPIVQSAAVADVIAQLNGNEEVSTGLVAIVRKLLQER